MKKYYFLLTIIFGVVFPLTSHIYILKLADPMIAKLVSGHSFPSPNDYPFSIVFWAYITAIEQVAILAIVYYYIGYLLTSNIRNKFYQILLLALILLELKDSFIRQTIMNVLVNIYAKIEHPFLLSVLSQIDRWIASILMAIILVTICPTKKYNI